jgi:itaconyl-CoA hydratase
MGNRTGRAPLVFEDFEVGQVFRSRLGRTITDADNIWLTALTHNTNQVHFNAPYAARSEFSRMLVNSTLTLALITGLSVSDTSENAVANLGWQDVRLPKPVFVGDTLWAETEVIGLRESRSRPGEGIVSLRSRGINQDGEVVIEFTRSFMVFMRGAAAPTELFPEPTAAWSVG